MERSLVAAAAAAAVRRKTKIPVGWLDLRGSGLSVLERLLLEEWLLRHHDDGKNWMIVGHHEPAQHHRYLLPPNKSSHNISHNNTNTNNRAVIVLGMGGKPERLLNMDKMRNDPMLTLRRFTGGGTVVLDHDSIWTCMIGRKRDFGHVESFPRSIMEWSMTLFGSLFQRLDNRQREMQPSPSSERMTLVLDSKSCGVENTGKMITLPTGTPSPSILPHNSSLVLRENDYVLNDHQKVAGNAQSIVKSGWLHHTSFLWDYQDENMQYLALPEKRPEYRRDRSHDDFLVKLRDCYPDLKKADFYQQLKAVCDDEFDLETVTLPDAMSTLQQHGGLTQWFEKGSRTRIVNV